MKITLLGTGTCVSGFARIPHRYPPAFLVEWGGNKMLFDCSEGVRHRLEKMGHEYADIRHVAISHAHPDHNAFVHFYQSVFVKQKWHDLPHDQPLHVYCPDQIVDSFDRVLCSYLPELGKKKARYDFPELVFHPMTKDENNHVDVLDAKLSSVRVHHGFGDVEALAFRLETNEGVFVYSGDTGDCDGIRSMAKDADVFVCESSSPIGRDMKEYGHLNPYEVGDICKQSNVKKVIFFHYQGIESNEDMINECRRSGFEGEIIIGVDFEIIEV